MEVDWEAILRAWNEEIAPTWKLPRLVRLTEGRKKKYKARLKEFPNFLDLIKAEIPRMKANLATGGWFTFDWIINSETNAIKLIEGNYRYYEQDEQKKRPQGATFAHERYTPEEYRKVVNYWDARYRREKEQGMSTEEGLSMQN